MRRIYLLLFVLLSGLAFAGNVPEEQARKMANAFWQSAPQTRGSSSANLQMVLQSESLATTRSSGMEPAYYVFDNTSGPGFVIVAGDDAAMPVLAYSFENEFPTDNMPANLQEWLEGMRDEINHARRQGAQATGYVARAWATADAGTPVVELETAAWDQTAPYNDLCPQVNRINTYTGCTATALAIVMRYHQFPAQGTGTLPAYTTESYRAYIEELPLGHTYDWANMKMEYLPGLYGETEAEAVATLMRDCAIGLQSDFGPIVGSGGTGAYTSDIPAFLTDHMGYDRACRVVYRSDYNTSSWNQLMKQEIDNNRPVLYGGASEDGSGGHAFVLEGYDTNNYFSVNWGWSGQSDGYFLLSALDPYSQGAGGSDSGFNYFQNAVIGIQPDAGGDYVEELTLVNYENPAQGIYAHGLEILEGTPLQGEPFTLQAGFIYNSGNTNFTGEVLVEMTNESGQIVEVIARGTIEDLEPGYGGILTFQGITIGSNINPGYRIRLYYTTAKNPTPTLVTGNDEEGCVWDLVISDLISIEKNTTLTYNKADRTFLLQTMEGVTAKLETADGTDHSDLCKQEGTSISIDASTLPGGSYRLTLTRGNDTKTITFILPEAN